jgi:hypothetical protein
VLDNDVLGVPPATFVERTIIPLVGDASVSFLGPVFSVTAGAEAVPGTYLVGSYTIANIVGSDTAMIFITVS